ncbi:hypothetical protein [Xanthomonas fragariae]|uniref:hypothetical protein n=1 Tax=Xanthomonas fragariae TaxID=48664 RepID=UPI0022AA1E02|nr:hypothetical protein [Xanthomonas fragariae]WAT13848.1 hypothetical protein OZ429_11895 [Xanthomonas fragariae]
MKVYRSSHQFLGVLTSIFLVSTLACGNAFCSDSIISDLVSLFNAGVDVEQPQIEKLIGTAMAKSKVVRDEPLRRHYRFSLNDPKYPVTALSFGAYRSDEGSHIWRIAALSAIYSDKKVPGCEKYDDIVKKYGFVEGIREPRSVIKGAAWTQPAILTKGPYEIYVSTTDVTSPCISGFGVSTRSTDSSSASTKNTGG